jgi:hypothetical protein
LYTEIPTITTSTPAERLQALKDAKELLAGSPEVTKGGIFGGDSTKPRDVFDTTEALRLAEYITTGHDYKDTHPTGRRFFELQKYNEATDRHDDHDHVHVHAMGIPREVMEQLLTEGSFEDLVRRFRSGDIPDADPTERND